MAGIILDNISKRFADGTKALQRTDLRIEDGELFILVGPSGCGKSTLLKIIVGLERPSAGEVHVGDRNVTGLDPKDRNMAMVFQSYALYPHMTVRENMAFPLRLAGIRKPEIAARVEQAAATLELETLLDRKPASLSGGQRQRVAMGRAIVREPAAFLLDEPLSNLDARLRVQMRTELAQLQRRLGTTTVYVTHDQTEAMTLGDRIAVMRHGKIQQIGTPRELYRRPTNLFVASFIGSPGMNLLRARVEGDRLRLPMTELPLPNGAAGRLTGPELVIGIRPEHLCEAQDAAQPGTFRATAELMEWLGADVFLHCSAQSTESQQSKRIASDLLFDGGQQSRLIARVGTDSRAAEGETLTLGIDPNGILLFEPETGTRIGTD
jgi:multiple sugar transport system ATP-binding protein